MADIAGLAVPTSDNFLDLDKFNEYDQQYKMVMIGCAISKSAHLRELSIQDMD
jgi:hypothetical protein